MQPKLSDLLDLAHQAGNIIAAGFGREHQIGYKGLVDPVTEVDRKSEAFLIQEIQARFPGHRIVAEESGSLDGQQEACWYIDPLDGTVNYAHSLPIFCVSIAYATQGQVALGVVYDPIRDECFSAERGAGAWLNETPIHIAPTRELIRSLLVTGFPYDMWNAPVNNLEYYGRFARRTQGVRRLGSAALDLCYVAAGRLDGYWEMKLNAWDIAAGGLIAAEAGAQVTDLTGLPDYLKPPYSILAANEALHAQMLAVLQEP